MGKNIDLTGKKFGRWLVLGKAPHYIDKNGRKFVMWYCKCSCGNSEIKTIRTSDLTSGRSKSCGCYNIERIKERSKKYNKYDLTGEYGIGYVEKTYNGCNYFLFDLEDYNKIKDYYWSFDPNGYLWAPQYNKKPSHVRMHRIIMGIQDLDWKLYQVDHIGGLGTENDNRKINLRIVNVSQNGMNKRILSSNTSGKTGVSWSNTHNQWVVQIWHNNIHEYIGGFSDFDEAVKARDIAEEIYHKNYSYKNSQKFANLNEVINNE